MNTIIVLDDEPDFLEWMANELRHEANIVPFTKTDDFVSHLTKYAADPQECFALIDIVLGDDMEGGFKVADQLNERNVQIPFIFISNSGLTENIVRSAEAGSHAFVDKFRLRAHPGDLRAALAQAKGAQARRIRESTRISDGTSKRDGGNSIVSRFPSVFISYGGPDEHLAELLNKRLIEQGVETFFFKQHATPGRKLHHVMRDGVNKNGRVILICSQSSLDRPGVLNEIEEALQREAREGGKSILIPISIDDYVFSNWAPKHPGLAQAIRDRVVADFRGVTSDTTLFEQAVARLIDALRG